MTLQSFLYKNALLRPLNCLGAFPVRNTPQDRLANLIKKLAPIDPGLPLIRLGPKGDGGYLVPDDFEGIQACFSPGVSSISGFEKDCAERGMDVFLADASVDGPAEQSDRFHFIKKFIGSETSETYMTLANWVDEADLAPDADLLLQMDIEGYEYEVLLSSPDELLNRFRIIVIECHRLDRLWNRDYFRMVRPALQKLLQTHTCVHIHPNNVRRFLNWKGLSLPPIAEFTFLRNDRFLTRQPATRFPHPLDSENTRQTASRLPKCWQAK